VRPAHERAVRPSDAGLAQLLLEHGQATGGRRRQRPCFHLSVRRRGEIGEAPAAHRVEGRAGRREANLPRSDERLYAIEELRQPASRVHPILGAGPAAELLTVVHEHGERAARGPQVAEVRADLRRRPEGDEIAEPLIDGKERDSLAATLGPEGSVQLVPLEATHEEVAVVEDDVAHAGVGQMRRQIGLPHPLGEPQPLGRHAEATFDRLAHPRHLLDPIGGQQGREHRLVEPREQELDVTLRRQAPDQVEVGRVMCFEPLEQRAREVQREREEAALRQPLDERPVDVPQMLLEHVVEVPHRLVQVDAEHEADRVHRFTRVR